LRRFYKLHSGSDFNFDEMPFIELSSKRQSQSITVENGKTTVKRSETQINDGITEFNKKAIFETIIDNGEYASQRLLKLAVAYRFVHKHYAGTDKTSDIVKTADSEEFILIREIVSCIVSEYNVLRRELKLEPVESELRTGRFENITIEGDSDDVG
jgi:intergrase/recombinase